MELGFCWDLDRVRIRITAAVFPPEHIRMLFLELRCLFLVVVALIVLGLFHCASSGMMKTIPTTCSSRV
jgi:hypothetical protein